RGTKLDRHLRFWQTGHVDLDGEDTARERIWFEFGRRHTLAGGGDVERAQVVTAKTGATDAGHGDFNDTVDAAIRGVAHHTGSAPARVPHIALGVDDGSIRAAAMAIGID